MSIHPLPKGTRVFVKHSQIPGVHRVLKAVESLSYLDHWRYTLCKDKHWETEGIIYVQLGPDVGEKLAHVGCWDDDVELCCDLPRRATAEEIYDMLRSSE